MGYRSNTRRTSHQVPNYSGKNSSIQNLYKSSHLPIPNQKHSKREIPWKDSYDFPHSHPQRPRIEIRQTEINDQEKIEDIFFDD